MKKGIEIKKNNRNNYIDWLKGVAIILVVLGHCWLVEYRIFWFIYRFHMPLFFCISGYLFNKKNNYKSFLISKIKTIIVPYIIFFIFSYIISINFLGENITPNQMLTYMFLNGKYCSIVNNWAIWYLPLFFIVSNLFYFIAKIKKEKIFYIILVALVVITVPVNILLQKITVDSYIPFSIQALTPGLLFMLIGYLYKLNKEKINNTKIFKKFIFLKSFILCFVGLAISIENFDQIINVTTYTYIITALLIIQFIITLTRKCNNKLICYIGRNSLIILGFHRVILFLFQFYKFEKILEKLNINKFFYSFIISAICIFIICFINQFITIILNFMTKKLIKNTHK